MDATNKPLNDALDLINSENFQDAKEILKKITEAEPNNFEAYKNLGLCEINLNNNDGAIEALQKAYELDNKDATSIYYYACCLSNKDKQKACALFQEVITLRPDFLDAYKSLAMIYVELAQTDLAIETALKAVNNPAIEADYSINYILATSFMLQKDYQNAVKYLKLALEFDPEHLSILNSLATCYMNIQEYDNAKDVLERAYKIQPNDVLTVYNLGICNQVQEEYSIALEYFKKAYSIEPNASMLSSLAFCALKSNDAVLASTLYQNLVSAYPNNSDYRYSYMEALEMLGDYEKALENADALLLQDEKNVILTKKKGTYLRKLGRYEESNDVFKILINRGKIDVEVYYNLAFNFVELADYDNAKEMFKKCIILEPNNPYAHKDLGVLYLKMNCYDWAVDEMQKAIELEDDIAEFYYSLGVSYMMLSEIGNAKEAFNKAIELDCDDANSYAYLGYAYLLERDFDKAQELLKKSLQIEPDNVLAKMHSSKLYFQLKKYNTAKEFLQDIIEKIDDDESSNMLAFCYMEMNEFDKAMGILYKLAIKYPKNHIILTNLAKCEHNCNKDKEAINHLRQALVVYDDFEDALNLLKEIKNV